MTGKFITNVNDDEWRKFKAVCGLLNVNIGENLSNVLKKYNKEKLSEIVVQKIDKTGKTL